MEEVKSKNGLYLFIIIFLLICLGGSGFFIYKRIYQEPKKEEPKQEENIMTDNEAIALGEEMYNKLYEFMESHPTIYKYGQMDQYKNVDDLNKKLTEEGLLYNNYFLFSESFEQNFYNVFSQNVKITDIFQEENVENTSGPEFRYVLVDNKYYVDTECRASGLFIKSVEFNVKNKTENLIDYSFIESGIDGSCPENGDCEFENTKEMQLIKEEGTWKINKVSELSPCEVLEKDS